MPSGAQRVDPGPAVARLSAPADRSGAGAQPDVNGQYVTWVLSYASGMPTDTDVDIVVRDPEGGELALVVQVRAADSEITGELVRRLKAYMMNSRCPVGLIVTPEKVHFFVDSFRDFSEASIEEIESIDSQLLLGVPTPTNPADLERAVVEWLERTSTSWSDALPSDDKAAARVIETLVPAVAQGVVSGSHS